MVCGNVELDDILDDIFYLSTYCHLSGNYIDNLTVFEREFYIQSLIKKLKAEAEAEDNNNG